MEKESTPIKVSVKLHPSQKEGFNKWKCTVNGEPRLVTTQNVEWFCMSIQDAVLSFKENEVAEFTIQGCSEFSTWEQLDVLLGQNPL